MWQILTDAGIDLAPERASSTWAQFLRSQAEVLLGCDFFETVTLTGARMYVLVAIEHAHRRIHILGATPHPTAAWITQTARDLIMVPPFGRHPQRVPQCRLTSADDILGKRTLEPDGIGRDNRATVIPTSQNHPSRPEHQPVARPTRASPERSGLTATGSRTRPDSSRFRRCDGEKRLPLAGTEIQHQLPVLAVADQYAAWCELHLHTGVIGGGRTRRRFEPFIPCGQGVPSSPCLLL